MHNTSTRHFPGKFGVEEKDDTEAIIKEEDSALAIVSTVDRIDLTQGRYSITRSAILSMEQMGTRGYGATDDAEGVLEGAAGGVGVEVKEDKADMSESSDLGSIGSSHM